MNPVYWFVTHFQKEELFVWLIKCLVGGGGAQFGVHYGGRGGLIMGGGGGQFGVQYGWPQFGVQYGGVPI